MIFGTINNKDQKLRTERAQILLALRDLLYKDMELIEDHDCDYCNAYDGHEDSCVFADAFELVLQERAQSTEGILIEIDELREVLMRLVEADLAFADDEGECVYCEDIRRHQPGCVMAQALEILEYV